LTTSDFIAKNDLILHPECFKTCFTDRCAKCCRFLDDGKSISAVGRKFHEQCFGCARCGDSTSPIDKFVAIYGFPYCPRCFTELEPNFPKCLTCRSVIIPSAERREFFFRSKKYFVHFPD
jgi:hypothetical protein